MAEWTGATWHLRFSARSCSRSRCSLLAACCALCSVLCAISGPRSCHGPWRHASAAQHKVAAEHPSAVFTHTSTEPARSTPSRAGHTPGARAPDAGPRAGSLAGWEPWLSRRNLGRTARTLGASKVRAVREKGRCEIREISSQIWGTLRTACEAPGMRMCVQAERRGWRCGNGAVAWLANEAACGTGAWRSWRRVGHSSRSLDFCLRRSVCGTVALEVLVYWDIGEWR